MNAGGLKVGAVVNCPRDRGDSPYSGQVTHVSPQVNRNIHGVDYVWVTVRKFGGTQSAVWPSHRLGFKVTP